MSGALLPVAYHRWADSTGAPLNGGLVFFFASGTSSAQAVYHDSALTQPWTQPVQLDAAGGATIYLAAATYRVTATNAQGVLQSGYPVDNVADVGQLLAAQLASSAGASYVGFTDSGTGAVGITLQQALRELCFSPIRFGADPTGVADSTDAFQRMIDALPSVTSHRFGSLIRLGQNSIFKISDTLTFPSTKLYRIEGAGMRTSIIDWQGGNSKPVFKLLSNAFGAGAGPRWGIELEHFAIENGNASTGCTPIAFDYLSTDQNDFIMARAAHLFLYGGNGRWNSCVYAHGAMSLEMHGIYGSGSVYGFLHQTTSYELESLKMDWCEWADWTGTAVVIDGISQGSIAHCEFQQNQGGAAVATVDRLDAFTFRENVIECGGSTVNTVLVHLGTTAYNDSNLSAVLVEGNHINGGHNPGQAGSVGLRCGYVKGAVIGGGNTWGLIETAIDLTANCSNACVLPQGWADAVGTKLANAATTYEILDPAIGLSSSAWKKGVTGAIATGATVAHGLASAPPNVLVTALDSGPTDVYVSAIGATTFVINYGGGGTHVFAWRADL